MGTSSVVSTFTKFATIVENASGAARNDVPSAGQASASPAEGEKNTTKDAETNLQNELADLLGYGGTIPQQEVTL
ncbi:hypothetical protein Tco_1287052 [Tanacetum coccineum]